MGILVRVLYKERNLILLCLFLPTDNWTLVASGQYFIMKKYNVTLSKTIKVNREMTVMANNPNGAKKIAQKQLDDMGWDHYRVKSAWEVGDE